MIVGALDGKQRVERDTRKTKYGEHRARCQEPSPDTHQNILDHSTGFFLRLRAFVSRILLFTQGSFFRAKRPSVRSPRTDGPGVQAGHGE